MSTSITPPYRPAAKHQHSISEIDGLQTELDDINGQIDKVLYSGTSDVGAPWVLDLSWAELLSGVPDSTGSGIAKIAIYGRTGAGVLAKGFYEVSAIWDNFGGGDLGNLETGVMDMMDSTEAFTVTTAESSGKLRLTMESTATRPLNASIIYSKTTS